MPKLKAFESVEDETPRSVGEEIGEAISSALSNIHQSNAQLAETLASSIATALKTVEQRNIVVSSKQEPAKVTIEQTQVTKWRFEIERDHKDRMTAIIATAMEER